MIKNKFKIAYLSMEIALENKIQTYAGGLGVLAGDILKSAADLKIPMIGITLLNRKGYFNQKITKKGEQKEEYVNNYDFSDLRKLKKSFYINIKDDEVKINVWEYILYGKDSFTIPVYFLDTDDEENKKEYRELTGYLYGGNKEYRLLQEIILGRGGIRLLQELSYSKIKKIHINEGHGALATIELFNSSNKETIEEKIEEVKNKCVFTTHTPIKAANDIFPLKMMLRYQSDFPYQINNIIEKKGINMTRLALYFSGYVNGVALSHQKVSSKLFPHYNIHAITNGVHSLTWTSPEFKKLYDKYIPTWRMSSFFLRNAFSIPLQEIWKAHQKAKQKLLSYIKKETGENLKLNIFTIVYARRFTAYKRPLLLFTNMKKLIEINNKVGKIQIIYAGKAHPQDKNGKKMIKDLYKIKEQYKDRIKIVFLENYNLNLAKLLVAGADLWLNNPLPPNEASGTSGMKAAHNGVLQLSTYDGWWREGCIHGRTGWTIRGKKESKSLGNINNRDAEDLYRLLEQEIIPKYYNNLEEWQRSMRFAIGINASYFNTERVLQQYIQEAYL